MEGLRDLIGGTAPSLLGSCVVAAVPTISILPTNGAKQCDSGGACPMNPQQIDNLARIVAQGSRRSLLAGIGAAILAALSRTARAQFKSDGLVALGGECSVAEDCQLAPGPVNHPAQCAENGFASDGPLNCCVQDRECCSSDADCCGDFRCAPLSEVCSICVTPPFPSRFLGQPCNTVEDCIRMYPGVECVQGMCSRSNEHIMTEPKPLNHFETVMSAAKSISYLETIGSYSALYDLMCWDAKKIIPREVVVGWYSENHPTLGARVAEPKKVHFAPWTWEVSGQTYANIANVAYAQEMVDGAKVRDEIRLQENGSGDWCWFFGRDRDFVQEQIERYPVGEDSPATPNFEFQIVDLGTGEGNWSTAYEINDLGMVIWGWGLSKDPLSDLAEDFTAELWFMQTSTKLKTLGVGSPIAMNNEGDLLATGFLPHSRQTVVYDTSTGKSLEISEFKNGWVTDISDDGIIVGSIDRTAHWLQRGVLHSIPTPEGFASFTPVIINDSGTIAGTAYPESVNHSTSRAVLFADGTFTILNPAPEAQGSSVSDLNNVGQVVGGSGFAGAREARQYGRAFLYDHTTGATVDIGSLPGYQNSVATGINDLGQVVGYSWLPTTGAEPFRRAFLYDANSGILSDLNLLSSSVESWQLVDALDINNDGLIVGRGFLNGQMHAFILKPNV